MFIRRTTVKLKPEYNTPAGQEAFEKDFRSGLGEVPGLITASFTPQADGSILVIAIYYTEQDAKEAAPQVREQWERVGEMLDGAPQVEHYGTDLRDEFW